MPPIRSRRASSVLRRRSIKRTPMASTPKKIDNNDIKDKQKKEVIADQQKKKDNNMETSIEEKKDRGGLLPLKNGGAKNTTDAGTMTSTNGGAGQSEAPAVASDPTKVEIYNIRIQQDFKKRVVLPPVNVWSRVVDKSSFLTGVLQVSIKRKAFLFDRRLAAGFYTCVLSHQGHLVVYTELDIEGFAVNLRKASKLTVKFAKGKPDALPLHGEPPKRTCKLIAKWRFGTVTIQFLDRTMNQWCTAIVQGLSDDPKAQLLASLRASMLNPPLCKIPGSKEPTITRQEMPAEEHPKQEQNVPILRMMKTFEGTGKEKTTNEQKEEGSKKQEKKATTTGAVNTASPAASSHSDVPDSIATDSDSNALEELEEEEVNSLAEPDDVEDQDSAIESSLYSDLDDDIGDEQQPDQQEEEDEGHQQVAAEEEDANGPPAPPPAPMKRHVTFSNLKTTIEAAKEDEEKAAEVSPAPSKNNNNTGNNSDAEEWMDAEDDGEWEPEEKKEPAVPSMTDNDWLPWISQDWEPEEETKTKDEHKKQECAPHTKDDKTVTSWLLPANEGWPTTSTGRVKNLQLHRDAAVQGPKPNPRCFRHRRVPVNRRRRIVKNNTKLEEES